MMFDSIHVLGSRRSIVIGLAGAGAGTAIAAHPALAAMPDGLVTGGTSPAIHDGSASA